MDFNSKELNRKIFSIKNKHQKKEQQQAIKKCLDHLSQADEEALARLYEELNNQRYMTEEEIKESNDKILFIRNKVNEVYRGQMKLARNGWEKDKTFLEYVDFLKLDGPLFNKTMLYIKELGQRKSMNKRQLTLSRQKNYLLVQELMQRYRKFREHNFTTQKPKVDFNTGM